MIGSPELAAWLGSRDRQARSHEAAAEMTRTWRDAPPMAALEQDLAALADPTPSAVLAAATRFIDLLEDVEGLVAALIERSRADPFFLPPLTPLNGEFQTALLLYHSPDLSIAFGVSSIEMIAGKKAMPNRPPGSVFFPGFHTLFRYLKAGGATLSFWERPGSRTGFSAADAPRCRCTGRRRLADGETFVIDGARESFIIDHAESDMVYLQVMTRAGASPLALEYDAGSCRFLGATGTDETGARVQMMATLLREMGRDDAVPWLRAQLPLSDFHIRWHLMREMLALDANAALPDLRAMAEADPHPEVRAAAAQTLSLFFDEPPAPESVACRA